jgi:hypothetical protein
VARELLRASGMKNLMLAICAAGMITACLATESAPEVEPRSFADKVEIDPANKTKCDGGNDACFAADKDHCKEGDYTGACWCTHCEGGNVCETEADHQKHDDKCKLKAATETFETAFEAD